MEMKPGLMAEHLEGSRPEQSRLVPALQSNFDRPKAWIPLESIVYSNFTHLCVLLLLLF